MTRRVNQHEALVCPPGRSRAERSLFSQWKRRHGGAGCWGLYKWRSSIRKDIVRAKLALVRCKGRPPDPRVPKDMPKHVRERYQRFQREEGRCTFAAWWKWQLGGEYPLKHLGG